VHFLKSYSNRDALAGYFAAIRNDWEMLHFSVGEFVAQGDAVFMRGSMAWRNKRMGKTVETPKPALAGQPCFRQLSVSP
jgi:hypothetical protein